MSSTLNYATVTDLENLLLVDVDASFEAQVETWITASETRVNNYLGFTTASGLWNESITGEINDARVDGDANLVIHPRKRPINSISSLKIQKGTRSITVSLTDGDGNNRYILPVQRNMLVYPGFELSIASSSVAITNFYNIKYRRWYTNIDYIAGYTAIPADISQATTLLTADLFMRHANKEGLAALTQGRISKRWMERRDGKSDLILDAEQILNHYRIASGWF